MRLEATKKQPPGLLLSAAALLICALGAYLLATNIAKALAATTVITPTTMDGWTLQPSGNASGSLVTGPATPPAGSGSMRLSVGPNGNDGIQLRNTSFSGTKLTDLTQLSYSTYVTHNSGCQAPYIVLDVDTNHNGTPDDLLFFEPCYQNGSYTGATVPNQGNVTLNTWQQWNALTGGWWSLNAGNGGPPLVTLAQYAASHSGATIVNSGTGSLGGLRVDAGFGAPPWNNFVGNVDNVTVGVRGLTTTYNFEPTGVTGGSSSSSSVSSMSSSSLSSSSNSSSSVSSSSSSSSSVSSSSLSSSSVSSSSVSSSLPSSSSSTSSNMCTPNVSNANLLGYWKFDEGSGTTAVDSSGNNHPGTLENGVVRTGSGAPQISPNPHALSFDGTNDQVRVSGSGGTFNFGSGTSFTVSAFVKTTSGNRSVLGNFNGSSPYRGWGLYLYSSNRVDFFAYGNLGINDVSMPSSVNLLDNNWHNITGVFTRSGNNITIRSYVDGTLIGTSTATVGNIASNSDLLFGHYLGQPNFSGSLDDIRVYARALSANEVQSLAGGCPSSSSSSSSVSSTSSSSSSSLSSSSSSVSSSSSTSSISGGIPTCGGLNATIYVNAQGRVVGGPDNGMYYGGLLLGSNGNDVIVGTIGPDMILGGNGDDVICGGGGNDFINGGNGNDRIAGEAGNDYIVGSNGQDSVCAGAGNDVVFAENGNDRIDGGGGQDMLFGGFGQDLCARGTTNLSCEQTQSTALPECSSLVSGMSGSNTSAPSSSSQSSQSSSSLSSQSSASSLSSSPSSTSSVASSLSSISSSSNSSVLNSSSSLSASSVSSGSSNSSFSSNASLSSSVASTSSASSVSSSSSVSS
ncbi:MAG TPA: LamG-like jellyroll fold domain-containing protein [Candidatus Peribacteraceae bacterium]|nr:LamG-like jellyroll fold domain-containing protein [Candidatus Peribacteraceae bacterium]